MYNNIQEPAAARTILGTQSPNLVFEDHTPAIDLTNALEKGQVLNRLS